MGREIEESNDVSSDNPSMINAWPDGKHWRRRPRYCTLLHRYERSSASERHRNRGVYDCVATPGRAKGITGAPLGTAKQSTALVRLMQEAKPATSFSTSGKHSLYIPTTDSTAKLPHAKQHSSACLSLAHSCLLTQHKAAQHHDLAAAAAALEGSCRGLCPEAFGVPPGD